MVQLFSSDSKTKKSQNNQKVVPKWMKKGPKVAKNGLKVVRNWSQNHFTMIQKWILTGLKMTQKVLRWPKIGPKMDKMRSESGP